MTRIVWNHALDTGIEDIDLQHRRLIDYINELDQARETGDRAQVGEVIEALVDYTQTHFGHEEELMSQMGFPDLENHRKVHRLFTSKLHQTIQAYEQNQQVCDELISMLEHWLKHHIRHEDGAYVQFAKDQGFGTLA
jgi:hemerythrin